MKMPKWGRWTTLCFGIGAGITIAGMFPDLDMVWVGLIVMILTYVLGALKTD